MRLLPFHLVALVGLSLPWSLQAEDWPQWRGPNRDDVSRETDLLKQWPAEGPRRVWLSREAGIGYSGSAVVGNRLYTMGAKDNVEHLLAFDANDGKSVWQARMGPKLGNGYGDGPRGTPTVDGERVYGLSGKGDLVCAQTTDGRVLWQTTMQKFGGEIPGWGYTESVLVDGNRVVCTPGGGQGALVALDKETGRLLWQSKDFKDSAQYSSIVPARLHGQDQYVQMTMKSVVGINPSNGEVLWRVPWPGRTAVIPTPIVHEDYVYVTAGYGVGCALFKIGANNQAEQIYKNSEMKNHHGGVLLYEGNLYGYSDGVGWLCQDFLTGREVWSERRRLSKGAVSCAGGMLYCLGEEDGTVVLAEASPKGWNEHGRFKLSPQTEQRSPSGHIWTHPVIAHGKLYLRDQELLFCYDISAARASTKPTASLGGE